MAVIDTLTIINKEHKVYALTSAKAMEETDDFWNARLGAEATAWAAANEEDKKKAIVSAADWEDRASSFTGEKTVSSQERDWPRDGATCGTVAVADGTTPDNIFYAQCWLAGMILVDNTAVADSGTGSNVKKAKAGSAEVEFFTPTIGSTQDHRLPQVAHDYIKCYLGAGTISLASGSGDDGESAFCDDDFDRSRGFA